jgi:DNA-binding SARP family transcriptional activator
VATSSSMASVKFRVLGPLEIDCAGQSIQITSSRQRVVLCLLLMAANQVVTVDRLIDGVWDERPPSSARSQIQICISALRRLIGTPDIIETSPAGYRIRIGPDQVDSGVLDSKLLSARAALSCGDLRTALEGFDAALGLWRGPPLAGVRGRAVAALASRLEERRITMIEDRIDTLLGLGAHRELTEELVALTSSHPWRERLWGFQMIALYRSGRQAEALAAYRAARNALFNELGLEPGRQLRQLEQAILSHDSSLDAAVLSPVRRARQLVRGSVKLTSLPAKEAAYRRRPTGEQAACGLPGWEFARQAPPFDTVAQQVEHGVGRRVAALLFRSAVYGYSSSHVTGSS